MTDIRTLLWLDFATCAAFALMLAVVAGPLEQMLGLPGPVRVAAIVILVAAALLMGFTARHQPLFTVGAWLVVAGNAAWVLASLGLVLAGGLTLPGTAFVLVQAAAVTGLTALEATALRRALQPA
ncbi:MAG: hypothetical protein KDK24_05255 [Pseudooceanicola sp.]|nr:hypothetical protein [Pseudooceanicola sp.]